MYKIYFKAQKRLHLAENHRCLTSDGLALKTMTYKLAKVLVFLSGILFLIWQIYGTFDTFIKNRTSFSIRQETVQSLVPPTIIFCPRNPKSGNLTVFLANVSNKNQFDEYFFCIRNKLNFSLRRYHSHGQLMNRIHLNLGKIGMKKEIFLGQLKN